MEKIPFLCYKNRSMSILRRYLSIFLIIFLAACSNEIPLGTSPGAIHPTETIQVTATLASSATSTETPTPSSSPTQTGTPTPTETPTLTMEPSPVTLMAVGDIMMARTVGDRILAEGPEVVFANMMSILSTADILAGNIECSITDRGAPESKFYTFAAPPLSAEALGLAGFDIAVLGNNHSLDYGQEGMAQTLELLEEQGIAPLGIGVGEAAAGPLILEKNGLRLAFLSYVDVPVEYTKFDTHSWIATDTTPGIAWGYAEDIQADVRAAKEKAHVVIVFMHFGYEEMEMPVRFQRDLAIAAINAGATAVIGSHTHVIQHVEEYHGGLIAYSMGNFVFDDYGIFENRSAVLRLVVDETGMLSYDFYPVLIVKGLPEPASPSMSAEILRILAP